MKNTPNALIAVIMMFSLPLLMGCARQGMNTPMDSSMDTMSQEKINSGTGSMQEGTMPEPMENMQNKDMGNSMEKTMK